MAEWTGAAKEDNWPGQETTKFEQEAQQYLTDVHEAKKARETDIRTFRRADPNQPAFDETSEVLRQNKVSQGVVRAPAAPPFEPVPTIPGDAYPGTPSTIPANVLTPRMGLQDLIGPIGQNMLASGLAMGALTPGPLPLKIAGGIAGAAGAYLSEEGTKRLQEQIGEVPGYIAGMVASLIAGGGVGLRGRTPSHPTQFKGVTIESPETKPFTIPPSGPLQRIDAPESPMLGGQPTIPPQPKTRLWQDEGIPSDTSFTPRLDEKYPTLEQQPTSARVIETKPIKAAGIDMGTTGPHGEYQPPKDFTEPPTPSRFTQAWNAEKQRWGQEFPVLKTTPDSPVISNVEATHFYVEDFMEGYVKQPWVKSLMKYGDNTKLAPLEKQWIADYKAGRDPQANMPDDFKQMFKRMDELLEEENAINRRRGVAEIPKTDGPYAPRMTDEDFKLMRSIARQQEGAKTSQSIGPFSQARTVETLDEGIRKGITYKDWRTSLLLREARGAVLRATDIMMTDLEKAGVLHRSKDAAEAVSLTGKAYAAEGLPFSPKGGIWYVRSLEERQFLLQNLRQMGSGTLADIHGWAQQFLRNPSLINPWPHIIKNMGLKQMQQAIASGLNPVSVIKQTFLHKNGKADMLEEFQQVIN